MILLILKFSNQNVICFYLFCGSNILGCFINFSTVISSCFNAAPILLPFISIQSKSLTYLEEVRNFVGFVSWCIQETNSWFGMEKIMFTFCDLNKFGFAIWSRGHPVLFTQAHNVVVIEMTGIPSDLWQSTLVINSKQKFFYILAWQQ